MSPPDSTRLRRAYAVARDTLLAERTPEGHWVGELSTSALSTAVAVSALSLVQKAGRGPFDALLQGGLAWLAEHQNDDGGWGDTVKSFSNISTTMLCRAAFHICGAGSQSEETLGKSEAWLSAKYGRTPAELADAVRQRYGKDRTFSVPILMTSALGGLVEWREVPSLPFELACFPQSWYRLLGLPVVSYALPALIAIGQAVYHHRPPRNPVTRLLRRAVIGKSLQVLARIQPSNGGFLEAAPLTAFVTMGLASSGKAGHPVVQKAVEFLVASVRPDGSWPIDTNLSTWVTTLAVNALAAAGGLEALDRKEELVRWLLAQQYQERHPYTGANPGAWAWTPLPGGVPDADDTPGALLALANLDNALHPDRLHDPKLIAQSIMAALLAPPTQWPRGPTIHSQTVEGIAWLYGLQNRDGGWPTFCRGWGKLPFDRSGCDLTAHALRALWTWHGRADAPGCERGLAYLAREQRPDGSWLPLWFGNQHTPDDINPTYGTAKVLAAYRDLGLLDSDPARRGVAWLLANQNDDGGWGGGKGTPSSIEETALAVEVLLDSFTSPKREQGTLGAVEHGLAWLMERVEAGELCEATPIGFYFAKLWYFEKLYPIIFTVAALGRACRLLSGSAPIGSETVGQ
jgi:squalene-hopene/tetraprenyl-beta-curcumene cyclase